MTIEISTAIIISVLSLGFSVFMGMKNSKRTDKKDIEERVRENTRINSELSSVRTDIQKHNDKIIILEQSCKQAHKRIDELNIRLNMNEDDEVKAYEKLEKLGKGRND